MHVEGAMPTRAASTLLGTRAFLRSSRRICRSVWSKCMKSPQFPLFIQVHPWPAENIAPSGGLSQNHHEYAEFSDDKAQKGLGSSENAPAERLGRSPYIGFVQRALSVVVSSGAVSRGPSKPRTSPKRAARASHSLRAAAISSVLRPTKFHHSNTSSSMGLPPRRKARAWPPLARVTLSRPGLR